MANTVFAPFAPVDIICVVKLSEPLFSYQEISSSLIEADKISMSPSLSTSSTYTEATPSAPVVTVWLVKLSEPLFSNQTTRSLLYAAPITSISPSKSTSAAYTS